MEVKSESEVAQSCLTLSNPMDCSPPGSSIHGIFQARVLKFGAIAFFGTNLRRAKTKRKKEFNLLQRKSSTFLEAWEKEISNIMLLKKNEKAEKYYTNEGTN